MGDLLTSGPLNKLGRQIAKRPRRQILGLALFGLLLFIVVSMPLVGKCSKALASKFGVGMISKQETPTSFEDRLTKATGYAYNAFFNLGLSKVNFISHYTEKRDRQGSMYEYIYWELWVRDDFSFEDAKALFDQVVVQKVQGLTLSPAQYDTKTYEMSLKMDGVDVCKVTFSKTGVEAEADAKTLAMVDVDRLVPKMEYGGPARIAVIIDDIGFRTEVDNQFLNLPASLAFAVIPYSPTGREFAAEAHRRGREILLHLPMEPKAYPKISPGKGGLLLRMGADEIRNVLNEDLKQVPYIKGVNNHMGSAFTSDAEKMQVVLERIKTEGLYFVDSRTAGSAKGYEVAQKLGIPSGARNIFLDHVPRPDEIAKQFDLLVKVAKRQGYAIAIGHPHTATLQVLRKKLPTLRKLNVAVIPPSSLVQ